jgi:urea transport system permease protein
VGGAVFVPVVGIIPPARLGVLPSFELWVGGAAGGRGTLVGAAAGAVGVNWMQSWLTTSYPDLWLLFLGALFMSVVLFFPDGIAGAIATTAHRLAGATGARQNLTRGAPSTATSLESANPPPTARAGPAAPLQ